MHASSLDPFSHLGRPLGRRTHQRRVNTAGKGARCEDGQGRPSVCAESGQNRWPRRERRVARRACTRASSRSSVVAVIARSARSPRYRRSNDVGADAGGWDVLSGRRGTCLRRWRPSGPPTCASTSPLSSERTTTARRCCVRKRTARGYDGSAGATLGRPRRPVANWRGGLKSRSHGSGLGGGRPLGTSKGREPDHRHAPLPHHNPASLPHPPPHHTQTPLHHHGPLLARRHPRRRQRVARRL